MGYHRAGFEVVGVGDNGRRERLWLSPGCHTAQDVLDFTGEAS